VNLTGFFKTRSYSLLLFLLSLLDYNNLDSVGSFKSP